MSRNIFSDLNLADRVAQLVVRLTKKPEVPGSIPGPATYFCFFFFADSRRVICI